MGKWMEEYGETLLAGMAGFVALMLILTSGILAVIGTRARIGESTYAQYRDFDVLYKLCQREKPKIVCDAEKQWYVGEIISIDEMFEGIDAEGKYIEVKVEAITDKNGVSYMEAYNRQMHQIIFQKAGIYVFELSVQDEQNLCVTDKIEISVDNRKVN